MFEGKQKQKEHLPLRNQKEVIEISGVYDEESGLGEFGTHNTQ